MSTSTSPGGAAGQRSPSARPAMRKRLRVSTRTGKSRKRSPKVSPCCWASRVVGQSTATCLPAVDGLEGGADGHLGLAEAHVAADQAVHGLGALHVPLGVGDGRQLVGGLLEEEGILQGPLQGRVGREGEARAGPGARRRARCSSAAMARMALRARPLTLQPAARAQLGQGRVGTLVRAVALDLVDVLDRHVDLAARRRTPAAGIRARRPRR